MGRSARGMRAGGVYVLVLLAVIVSGAMVVTGLELVRSRHQRAGHMGDYWQASENAAAGLAMAIKVVETEDDWRWSRSDGAWFTDLALPGGGTVTVEAAGVVRNAWDTLTLTSIGEQGGARAISSVRVGLQPGGGPAQIGPALASAGVLAWWPLDGADSSWHHEAISGAAGSDEKYGPGTTYPGAIPGPGVITAPWFWGSSSLKLDDNADLGSVRSIAFWFFAESVGSHQVLVERTDSGVAAGEWAVWVSGGRLVARNVGSLGLSVTTDAPVTAGSWHHVVLVAEDSRAVLYLDGAIADVGAMAAQDYWIGSGTVPVRVAGMYSGAKGFEDPFTGSVCDLLVTEHAMGSADVAALHAAYGAPGRYRALADTWGRGLR